MPKGFEPKRQYVNIIDFSEELNSNVTPALVQADLKAASLLNKAGIVNASSAAVELSGEQSAAHTESSFSLSLSIPLSLSPSLPTTRGLDSQRSQPTPRLSLGASGEQDLCGGWCGMCSTQLVEHSAACECDECGLDVCGGCATTNKEGLVMCVVCSQEQTETDDDEVDARERAIVAD